MGLSLKLHTLFVLPSNKKSFSLYMLLILSLSIFSSSSSLGNSSTRSTQSIKIFSQQHVSSFQPIPGISIKGDTNFINLKNFNNWKGSGSRDDPIIIEHYNITATKLTSNYIGFSILDTSYYFIFRQNIISLSSLSNSFQQYGIVLNNTANGIISDNNITSTSLTTAILIQNSINTTCINNIINKNYFGILISDSNAKILNNLIMGTNTGTEIAYSSSTSPWSLSLEDNIYFSNSIAIHGVKDELLRLNLSISILGNVISNNQYGINLVAFNVFLKDNYFVNTTFTALDLTRAFNSVITNNEFDRNAIGIRFSRPGYNLTLTQCFVNSQIPECRNATINPVILHQSNVTVINNIIANQSDYGLYVDNNSDYNNVIANNFINNAVQAHQLSSTNTYSNNSIGNYWSDYTGTSTNNNGIGDTPYYINYNGVDNKPIIKPLTILINNSALGLIKYVTPGLLDSIIFYALLTLPFIIVMLIVVAVAIVFKYKRYSTSVKGTEKKLSFTGYFRKQMTVQSSKKKEKIHVDDVLNLLEEIMDENQQQN